MIPARFSYQAPTSVADAVAVLGDDAKIIGGGTWVVPALDRGELQPATVVDLRRAGLGSISQDGDTIRVGATCTYTDVLASDLLATHLPLLQTMAAGVTGGRQILGQGTLGGSAAAARPSSDVPAVVVALGGRIVLAGPDGGRTVDARDFFLGPERTVMGPRDLLVAMEFRSARRLATGYEKLKHGQSSWPIATAAAVLERDGRGHCTAATVTLGGVAGVPVAVDLTEELAEHPLTEDVITAAARTVGTQITEPWGDVLAPADYRRAVAPALAARALRTAAAHEKETLS